MNYGRFFKFNQDLSKVVNGVTIFDYTDLPAHDRLASDVSMSPKYPISVSITANAVRFKMHYCVYRSINIKRNLQQEEIQKQIQKLKHREEVERHQHLKFQKEKRFQVFYREGKKLIPESIRRMIGLRPVYEEIDTGMIVYGGEKNQSPSEQLLELKKLCENLGPIYGFSLDDIMRQLHGSYYIKNFENDRLDVVHMEEVILELPFAGIGTSNLTDIIKNTYFARFPQVTELDELDDLEKIENDSELILTGSRFLNELIKKKLLSKKINQDALSYSTHCLMDLYDENGKICLNSSDNLVNKFLRKLLLDFMFDLKHSDLFQICPRYDQMYSGLMANYYFSSLMHKCEYYYYRDLTTQAIKDQGKKKQERGVGRYDEKKIIYLYAKELFDAEEQWANDIRNPLSDKYFKQNFPDDFSKSGKSRWGRLGTEIASVAWERMTSKHWDSWFASPEEEMRRIYFISKKDNQPSICNSVSLIEYLHLYFNNKNDTDEHIKKELISSARDSRGKSSRWFLNRFDYNDTMHMHLFRSSNLLFMLIAIIIIALLFFHTNFEGGSTLLSYLVVSISLEQWVNLLLALPIIVGLILFIFYICTRKQKEPNDHYNPLVPIYRRFAFKKLMIAIITITFFVSTLFLIVIIIRSRGLINCYNEITSGEHIILTIAWFIMLAFLIINYAFTHRIISYKCHFMSVSFHLIKSWHMLLPKLTASITAAWIPLAMSYDNYNKFLQSHISIFVLITIVLVVVVFFMYQVDHDCPSCSSLVKVLRSFEQFLISFSISLTIGAICLLLKKQGTLYTSMLLDVYYIKIWIKLSVIAMFTGLFLNAIFRSKNQMTDI